MAITFKSKQLDASVKGELIKTAQNRLEKMATQLKLREGLSEHTSELDANFWVTGFLNDRSEWLVELHVAQKLFDFCLATEGHCEGWEETWEDLNIVKQENGLYLLDGWVV